MAQAAYRKCRRRESAALAKKRRAAKACEGSCVGGSCTSGYQLKEMKKMKQNRGGGAEA